MYNHIVKPANQFLIKKQELPKNTTVDGNETALALGGSLGSIELVMLADTTCTLTAGTSIILSLKESDTENGVFLEASTRTIYTPSETKTWNAGECILRLPISSYSKTYITAVLETTDTACTGTVSVFPSYLPK